PNAARGDRAAPRLDVAFHQKGRRTSPGRAAAGAPRRYARENSFSFLGILWPGDDSRSCISLRSMQPGGYVSRWVQAARAALRPIGSARMQRTARDDRWWRTHARRAASQHARRAEKLRLARPQVVLPDRGVASPVRQRLPGV